MPDTADKTRTRLLLGQREAAGALDIGVSKLHELIHEGRLRAIRIGRDVKVPRTELERFIAEQPDCKPGGVA